SDYSRDDNMVFRVRPKRQFGSVHPNRARLTRHPTRYTAACLPADLFGRGAQKREDVTGLLASTAPLAAPCTPSIVPGSRMPTIARRELQIDVGNYTRPAGSAPA